MRVLNRKCMEITDNIFLVYVYHIIFKKHLKFYYSE